MANLAMPKLFQQSQAASGDARLPAWREDLALQAAPRGIDGAPHWNIYDPTRNKFFRIGWLEFMLLSHWQSGMTINQLCERVRQASPLKADVEDVLSLLRFLHQNELLRASHTEQRNFLLSLAKGRELSVWQWLLHHYLFVRIPLVRPEAFLSATQGFVERLFRPSLLIAIALLSLIGVWRVLDQWQAFSQTFLYFFSWQGALCYGLALGMTKLLHELGHAYVSKHYGLRVPTMGVAIMMLWPLLYTDTSEGWKLDSRRARLAIGGAGIAAELMLAGLAAFAWSILPEGPLKSAAYVLAAVTWISTLAVNLNPFMRFDGYYLLMDWLDMPNLHERTFAMARWHLRRLLLGWQEPLPEPEYESRQGLLIAYAYLTWLYRLVLFTGIAATVYYFFFKLAGIILFAVEIGWFVVRPVWQEMRVWQLHRARWFGSRRAWLSLLLAVLLVVVCAIPWQRDIRGEGYWQAVQHTRLYPAMSARVVQILVQEGQTVAAGQTLFVLQAPEIEAQMQVMESRIQGIEAQLAGSVGDPRLIEQTRVWQQELAAAQAERQSQIEARARLTLTAPHAGVVRDLDAGLYPGAWVYPPRLLARLIAAQQAVAQIYVNENDVARVKTGSSATLLPRRADTQAIKATVTNIDPTATHVLPHPMLASTFGGPIAVRGNNPNELTTSEAWYRVSLSAPTPNLQMGPVSVHIDGDRQSLLGLFFRQVVGVLIRESGL